MTPSVIGLINIQSDLLFILKCATSLELSAQALLISTQKIGLIRVTYDPLSVLGLINI